MEKYTEESRRTNHAKDSRSYRQVTCPNCHVQKAWFPHARDQVTGLVRWDLFHCYSCGHIWGVAK